MANKFNPTEVDGFDIQVDKLLLTFKDRFVMAPFSVLDARQGDWQSRKRAWLALGIKSELGRGENALKDTDQLRSPTRTRHLTYHVDSTNRILAQPKVKPGPATAFTCQSSLNKLMDQKRSRPGKIASQTDATNSINLALTGKGEGKKMSGTSIFDPVLCELAYSWWCPPGGSILDPFAGGSVRGIVAAMLGYRYTGIELREEQVFANRLQWEEMESQGITNGAPAPIWIAGDSMNVRSLVRERQDFILSCPPYGPLEKYSDDPKDISNMTYEQFLVNYRIIIKRSCSLLKDNRLACFVVGDFRDKETGFLQGFVEDTTAAFVDSGLGLYNDAILITAVGSLAVRTSSFFSKYRKLGRSHQMVMCYFKGPDWRELKALFE